MGAARLAAEVLLFDMDGTLVDSSAAVEGAWRRFAARTGLDAEAILAVAHGRPTVEVIAEFATPGMDVAAETARIEAEEVDRTEGIVAITGAAALLGPLDPDRWAVVTSATTQLARRRLATAGLPRPKVLVSADDVMRGKPDPEGYLAAAEALGSTGAEAVVFEDAEAGILAGRGSGATAVVVGGYDGPAARGLPRVPDLREVRVRSSGSGLEVVLPG